MQQDGPAMEVAVVGVGRMGRHHARIYRSIPQAKLVAVVDADVERAETVADEFGCRAYGSTEELLAKHPGVRAVSIAVPTKHHAAAAGPLLDRRIACLVEKPLAPTVAEAKALAQHAAQTGAVLQVGHTERFNPAVRAVAAMELTPRFVEVDRVSPMTFRSLDVGVVLDVMIHDLDIVLMLARSPIAKVDAIGIAVLGEHEDVANARVVFENGCVADLSASRLALKVERKMRLFSESAYVSLDYQKRTGVAIRRNDNEEAIAVVREELEAGQDLTDVDYSSLVRVQELTMDLPEDDPRKDSLTAELISFLEAVERGDAPMVSAEDGYAAVEAAERVVASMREHRWEGMSSTRLELRSALRQE